MVLGLDLQGGAYLLYEVDQTDYVEKRLTHAGQRHPQGACSTSRASATPASASQGRRVQLRVRDLDQLDDARKRLEPLRNPLNASLIGGCAASTNSTSPSPTTAWSASPIRRPGWRSACAASSSSRSRSSTAASTSSARPSRRIQRQGDDRILVEAPGLGDPARLKALVGQTAQLTFHLVQSTLTAAQAARSQPTPGTVQFPSEEHPDVVYVVEDTPLMTGEDLVDAQAGFDSRTNEPVVNFRLSTVRRAQLRRRHREERRPALRHRARQQGDLGPGDPRADPRRLGPDQRQLHRADAPTTSPSCCAPARCRPS